MPSKTIVDFANKVKEYVENGINGVNLLDMSLGVVKADNSDYGTWSDNVFSTGNVSFTVNNDGTVKVDVSGTASGTQTIKRVLSLKAGTYYISGCPADGSQTTYATLITNEEQSVAYGWDYGEGCTLTLANDETIVIKIRIQSGYTTINKIFSLMVSKIQSVFHPYNSQAIQNQIDNINTRLSVGTIVANSSLNDYYKTGDYYSNTGSNTATLSDKPSDLVGAFRLSVICANFPVGQGNNATTSPITQKIELINGATPCIYMRHKTGGGSTWGSWYKFTGTEVQ